MSKIQSGQYKEGKFSHHTELADELKNLTPFKKQVKIKRPMPEERKNKISFAHSKRKLTS